ncbi:hypothetical protein NPIL_477371 [Nephila pilipes]|uniref:Uncharacterized protein n=1 Tax=Nephila pilipes TaxID=299642 RepID=A0A8X6PRK3_NEPPI|nr:hypothetical protein NPIL_477371 [Nephila pilipes]
MPRSRKTNPTSNKHSRVFSSFFGEKGPSASDLQIRPLQGEQQQQIPSLHCLSQPKLSESDLGNLDLTIMSHGKKFIITWGFRVGAGAKENDSVNISVATQGLLPKDLIRSIVRAGKWGKNKLDISGRAVIESEITLQTV